MGEIENFQLIVNSLRMRSRKARRTAWFSVSLIITTVFLMIAFFYLGEFSRVSLGSLGIQFENYNPVKEPKDVSPDLRKLELEIELEKARWVKDATESMKLIKTIAESVAKVGAVFIAIYLVQILFSLTRYHFRIADHLEGASDILNLAGDDHEKMQNLMLVLATTHIDFGKAPTAPVDKLLDTIKEALGKRA